MRLTGEGIYGEPPTRPEAFQILKRTVESDINFLDTADYYGDDVTNRLIAEALYPYQDDLVICTKVGTTRKPDKSWIPFNKSEVEVDLILNFLYHIATTYNKYESAKNNLNLRGKSNHEKVP
jgi:aryl-alcohol dehydrogenase-like predicted oxidoreductase